jgi:hypothetical protein
LKVARGSVIIERMPEAIPRRDSHDELPIRPEGLGARNGQVMPINQNQRSSRSSGRRSEATAE